MDGRRLGSGDRLGRTVLMNERAQDILKCILNSSIRVEKDKTSGWGGIRADWEKLDG